jgi:hypothetical protein
LSTRPLPHTKRHTRHEDPSDKDDRRAGGLQWPARTPLPDVAKAWTISRFTALQQMAGNQAVQRLVRMVRPPGPDVTLNRAERRDFVRREFTTVRDRADGLRVIEDMANTSDVLHFASAAELRTELVKRVTMTQVMRDSQDTSGGLAAFGYPFTGPSLYYGPRVNYAARDYWVPAVPDGYDLRRDATRRAAIRMAPRHLRHLVFGDQPPGYSFILSPLGRADPYEAILRLFERQPAHKRSLVHCDYLVSLVHFRAFMASLGRPAFNARIAAHGPSNIVLRWNLFAELEPATLARPGLGSIRQVVPSSPTDLVIGDHVTFFNHPAYDVINRMIGNAWRLENAILIERAGGADVFLGHGSGRKTAQQMQAKLAEEYNDVAMIALRLVGRTKRGSTADRTLARAELATRFPEVIEVASTWRILGTGLFGISVDIPLARLRASAVPGFRDPRDTTVMFPVRRPAESA